MKRLVPISGITRQDRSYPPEFLGVEGTFVPSLPEIVCVVREALNHVSG